MNRFDNYIYVGMSWNYQISFLEEMQINDVVIEQKRNTYLLKNKLVSFETTGLLHIEVEMEDYNVQSIPGKLKRFFSKYVGKKNTYCIVVDNQWNLVKAYFKNINKDIEDLKSDSFFRGLDPEKQKELETNLLAPDDELLLENINQSLIYKFCYFGYLSPNLSEEGCFLHSKQVRSNFLENYHLPIDFTINLHAKTSDERNLNIIYNGLPNLQKVDLNNLYQQIDNYYDSDDSQLFDDYRFQVMGDYYIDVKYHYINKAQIEILETLNDEQIQYSTFIEILNV